MRRLSLLIVGFILAFVGARIVADAELFAPHLLVDALLLGLAGGLVFAFQAGGWQAPPVLRRRRGLSSTGWLLLLTGLAVALGGGAGLGLGWTGIGGQAAAIALGLGIVLQLAGAWWPGAASEYARPATHWGKDAAGNFVPLPAGEGDGSAPARRRPAPGLGVRLLEPAGANAAAAGLALDTRLAALLAQWTQSSLLGLRLASALFGWLTVLGVALALRRLVGPLPALLGAALLALSPWHLWAGRSSDPWLAAGCLAALALWLGLEALARSHARWWLPWGVAAGLLAAQTPALWPAVALWVLVVAGLGLGQARRQAGRVGAADYWRWPLCGLLAALGAALPAYGAAALPAVDVAGNAAVLAGALLRPEATAAGALVQSGLLSLWLAALALLGAGVLLRHWRQGAASLVLAGSAGLAGAAALLDLNGTPPATALLPALPLFVALAAVALDRLLAALVAAWGPPLVRASTLLAGSALVLLLRAGRGAFTLLWELDTVRSGGEAQAETDMARYIAARLGAPEEQNATFIAPQAVLDQPSLRLLAGGALDAGRVQPLALGRTLPLAQPPSGAVVYLLPLLDTQLLELLRQLYPNGVAATELDTAGERALFNRFTVAAADLLAAQTLQMTIAPADPAALALGAVGPEQVQAVPALDFAWAAAPPHELPFTAQWRGSLVLPQSGNYTFAVASSGVESTFTLTLDDILLLDSSLALNQQQMTMERGIHRLRLDYRSGNQPGDLRITLQPEGETAQTLAAPLLHSPQLPDQGLLGDYFSNAQFMEPVVAAHRDPIIGLEPGLPLPYSVYWHGLLAAPRAGEYLIGVDAPGAAQVMVNGNILADNRGPAFLTDLTAAAAPRYDEGLIYLPAGWQRIEVRYAVEEQAGALDRIRLLWQPPGSDPAELASRYLLPAYGLVGPADAPLPPAPALNDPLLGDDRFALSRPATSWQPHTRLPAANLPPLALERLWTAGGISGSVAGGVADGVCGDAAEQLNMPHGAVFAADGSRLYVADTGNRRIQVYSAEGEHLETITSAEFQEPVAVALTPEGDLLVLDALAQLIYRVRSDRSVEPLPLQTSFYRPRGLAVAATGDLVVADTGGARVVVLAPDGSQTLEFGGQGSLVGRGQPVGVLAADGALWAISAEDGRLWNLTSDGSLTAVQPTGTLDGPHLAQLSDGRLLASDPGRAAFVLFSPLGEPLAQFAYAGELQLPTGIAATPGAEGDLIAVVDTRACQVSAWRLAQ